MVRAKQANAAVDSYHSTIGWGQREVTVNTVVDSTNYARRLDIADVNLQKGIEYKMGYQTAMQSNLWEVARNKVLVDQGWQVEWVFRDQASKPLLEALEKAGISTKVGH